MAINTNYLTDVLPPEMRSEVLSHVPLKSFLWLRLVCKMFRDEITNEFLRDRCHAYFPQLGSIPQFVEPLVRSVDNPWGWICYSLSCQKVNKALYPIAETLARTSLGSFQAYLQAHIEKLRNEQQKIMGVLGLSEHDDINEEIELAEAEANERWLDDDQAELEQLQDELIDLGLLTPYRKIVEEADTEAFLSVEPIPFATREKCEEILKEDGPLLIAIKKRCSDPNLIKMVKLIIKFKLVYWRLDTLEELRTRKGQESFYLQISQTRLQQFATAVFYHTLYFLPHLKNWMPHFEKAKTFGNFLLDGQFLMTGSTDVESIMKEALPDPFPRIISKEFSMQAGSGKMSLNLGKLRKLFEIYCDSYFIISERLQRNGNFDLNPAHDLDLMLALLKAPQEKSGTLFTYPEQNPDLEAVKEKLEEGQTTMEALLLSQDEYDIPLFENTTFDEAVSSEDE